MLEPVTLSNITHPFINSIYMKKEFADDMSFGGKNILVIEAKPCDTEEDREENLLAFLSDLDLIKDEVERKAGKFSRLDIKYH